ncbi:MAG: macro domain-containing protein [Rhodothermales bacterium]
MSELPDQVAEGKIQQRYTIGNSTVTLRIGDILDSRAQVLVSSDDDRLNMGGGVSRALHRAAGDAYKLDAQAKYAGHHDVGDVVVTGAGAIPAPCQYVFHAISRRFDDLHLPTEDQARTAIRRIVGKAMALLEPMGLSSIAFPAVGTGAAAFAPEDVALVMADVLRDDLTAREASLDVEIYIYPDDMAGNTYGTFFKSFDMASGWLGHIVRDHLVVMIHGIRTEARWFDDVTAILREEDHQLNPVSTGYEYFDVVRFLLPFRWAKRRVIERVEEKLLAVIDDPASVKVSVVAHSFGTYVLGEVLQRNPRITINRLILCGAVLPQDFRWSALRDRLTVIDPHEYPTQRLLNECGWRDTWPVLAQFMTWGYGSSGRFGFQSPLVKDRFHDLDHSGFFQEAFVRDYWCPFITEGVIKDSAGKRPPSPWWLQVLTVLKFPILLLGFLALAVWLLAAGS